jgi:hypothetical protein
MYLQFFKDIYVSTRNNHIFIVLKSKNTHIHPWGRGTFHVCVNTGPVAHRVGRVLSFFSNRRMELIGTPPTPHPHANVPGHTRWRERGWEQRWALTLANRLNARHRSNIRALPRPLPPDLCIQSVGICVARGVGSDS